MNPRELLIFLLGLAIVAVVLRGLYVAIQARRGQIRLAIDKNIPSDVDLDALEMAELPGGGARVKSRSAEHPEANAEVQRAAARANAMDLGGHADDGVPVLMDAVQVRKPADVEADALADQELDYFDEPGATPSLGQEGDWSENDWSEDDLDDGVIGSARTVAAQARSKELGAETGAEQGAEMAVSSPGDLGQDESRHEALDEDPDDVLLDYEADGMSALAPDYDDSAADHDDGHDEEYDEEYGERYVESGAEEPAGSAVENWQDDYLEDDTEADSAGAFQQAVAHSQDDAYDEEWASDADDEASDPLADDGTRPAPQLGNFEDDLEEFSMSAGERIGYEGKPRRTPARQTSLFDHKEQESAPADRGQAESPSNRTRNNEAESTGKRKSLFAAFKWKKPSEKTGTGIATESSPASGSDSTAEQESKSAASAAPRSAQVTSLESPAFAAEQEIEPDPSTPAEPQRLDEHEAAGPEASALPTEPSEVLVINVMASHGRKFAGDDLMHVLITSGLKFGDMNIFHQRLGNQPKGPVIFSVANMLNPGTFDLNNMESFRTVGVSLFLALPTAINNLDAFEKMLAVARQLCADLGGELKDDNRNGMTAQTIEHYRQRVRDFELRQLKAAGSRG